MGQLAAMVGGSEATPSRAASARIRSRATVSASAARATSSLKALASVGSRTSRAKSAAEPVAHGRSRTEDPFPLDEQFKEF